MNFTWQEGHVNGSGCLIPDRWHASNIPGCTLFVEPTLWRWHPERSGLYIGYVRLGNEKLSAVHQRKSIEKAQRDAEQIAREWMLDYFAATVQQLEKAGLLEVALEGIRHDAD